MPLFYIGDESMELLAVLWNFFVHLDLHLNLLVQNYGNWAYLVLFLIIFCETGLVITPFLPGDSLLFALGALAAGGTLDLRLLLMLLCLATIIGDSVNYWIGYAVGPKIFNNGKTRFLRKEYLDRTHRFYEKHGGKTITFARFIPIIRTFAPFVAGIGRMNYWWFLGYSITGGICWITVFIFGGFYFGNIPVVKRNFTLVIMAIVCISLLPAVVEFYNHLRRKLIKNHS